MSILSWIFSHSDGKLMTEQEDSVFLQWSQCQCRAGLAWLKGGRLQSDFTLRKI